MLTTEDLKNALATAIPALDEIVGRGAALGLEREIQLSLLAELQKTHGEAAQKEKWLKDYGGTSVIHDVSNPRIDIVYPGKTLVRGKKLARVVELKVLRLPRLKRGSPMQALYDWGQMTADYARTQRAKDLEGGELVALLYGPGIEALAESDIERAFHNHLFLDYETARRFGELDPDYMASESKEKQEQRKLQKKAGKELGWDRPYLAREANAKVVKVGRYAVISIPIPSSSQR
ncbi:hypothetical protein GGR74_000812 [Xanthomonas arboricola]